MKDLIIIKYRWLIIIVTILIVVAAIFPLLKTGTNSDLASYLPESMSSRVNEEKIEDIFGKSNPVLILFETNDVLNDSTLTRLQDLSKSFNRLKEFDMVMSIFDAKNIKGEQGSMIVDPVVKRIPKTNSRREKLREEIKANEQVYKLMVSEDFQYTILILNAAENISDEEIVKTINATLKEFPGSEKVSVFGQPFSREEINNKVAKDFIILLPIGLLLMFLFLIVSFRQLRGAVLPFTVVIISIIIAMAAIPLLGWKISVIGVLVPIMMIAIANNYGVHFITRFQEFGANHPEMTVKQIVTNTTQYLKKPVIMTGLTTIVGVGGLITHIMIPARQIGVASVIGIAFALLLSLTFIPAVVVMLKKGKVPESSSGKGNTFIDRILGAIGQLTTKKPRLVIYFFVTFLILSTFGLSKLKLAADNSKIFPEDHPFNHTLSVVNKEFGGTKNIRVIFEGDIKDPAILSRMDYYEHELKKLPEIANVTSIASIIKIMSKAINDPNDALYNKIPDTREGVAQYLELYSMSGDPADFEDFVDFDYTKAMMAVQFRADDMESLRKVENTLNSLTKEDENVTLIGGYSLVEKELSEAVAKGQVYSLIFAFIAVGILLIIIFRSFSAGILGSLPLVFTVVAVFGIMGWLGMELNIVTALLSSISIGLGVDYAIHLFWRLKTEMSEGKNYEEAIKTSLRTIGRGITINAFSVILGFAVLFLSAFPYIHSFAFLIITSLALCLLGTLVLIPAICMLSTPKFLKK
jgi:predicted RND superfamily exporter protein